MKLCTRGVSVIMRVRYVTLRTGCSLGKAKQGHHLSLLSLSYFFLSLLFSPVSSSALLLCTESTFTFSFHFYVRTLRLSFEHFKIHRIDFFSKTQANIPKSDSWRKSHLRNYSPTRKIFPKMASRRSPNDRTRKWQRSGSCRFRGKRSQTTRQTTLR